MYNVHSLTLHNKETHKKMNCLQILNSSYMPFPLLFPIYINLTSKPNTISSVYEIIMHTLYVGNCLYALYVGHPVRFSNMITVLIYDEKNE